MVWGTVNLYEYRPACTKLTLPGYCDCYSYSYSYCYCNANQTQSANVNNTHTTDMTDRQPHSLSQLQQTIQPTGPEVGEAALTPSSLTPEPKGGLSSA